MKRHHLYNFQESCGYVAQKCDLLPGLTVRQTLNYAAALTIGSKVTINFGNKYLASSNYTSKYEMYTIENLGIIVR